MSNVIQSATSSFFRIFDLVEARHHASQLAPASHQRVALAKLNDWFARESTPNSTENTSTKKARRKSSIQHGGIMVLPTGGGKTFTAARFLCRGPLSRGFKVIWLAHTHHLLDQAYDAFAPRSEALLEKRGFEVGLIEEPRETLRVRVVSGAKGHFPSHSIRGDDDIIIATLQTMGKALEDKAQLPGLRAFLKSAPRLFVVFDEAHHSPAPSYRALLESLNSSQSQMWLLGLTATPVHSDQGKRGWLSRLFPQGILHQVSAKKLMAEGILARPILEHLTTHIEPKWDEREYQKWLGTYRDLPESVIEHLAQNRDRNRLIAETYVQNRARYGKTLIFAERWFQCEQICEFLRARGVRADAVYSHSEAQTPTHKRVPDANERALQAFRDGELDVLVNVRMLTEGTDVPDVQSVFLTRQTTSRILLAQMVGRALRGPKFGGTKEAYIVSFEDNWGRTIPWAQPDSLSDEPVEEEQSPRAPRPPLQLISIEMVRRLARQTDGGEPISASFTSLMPLGWYETVFDAVKTGSDEEGAEDEIETVRDFTLAFDGELPAFERFIARLQQLHLEKSPLLLPLSKEALVLEEVRPSLEQWRDEFFSSRDEDGKTKRTSEQEREEFLRDLLDIARHVAQRDGEAPRFFAFDERQAHDLDAIAGQHIAQDLGVRAAFEMLGHEYARHDRYWQTLYPNFAGFQLQYNACLSRLLSLPQLPPAPKIPVVSQPQALPEREPSDQIKRQVKKRDGGCCLCCGETNRRRLQVDHIAPSFVGGSNAPDNLQTLCSTCNGLKNTQILDFRQTQAPQRKAPASFPNFPMPDAVQPREAWQQHLQRRFNFFYGCAGVEEVRIGARGTGFYEWEIKLRAGNDPQWMQPHLQVLLEQLRAHLAQGRRDKRLVERLLVTSAGARPVAYPLKSSRPQSATGLSKRVAKVG